MTTKVKNETSAKIAEINDRFRRVETMTLTKGVFELRDVLGLIRAVRDFDSFTKDNDPYGEHDFGKLVWENTTIFWKMDYYDPSFELWCGPLHPECERVITVMTAEEY